MLNRVTRLAIGPALVVVALAACGSSSWTTPSSGTSAPAVAASGTCDHVTDITFQLNWLVDYEQVPYYVAKDKGYYRDECLNVNVQPGRGSADTTTVVGSGTAQIGIADTVAVIQAQAKELPLTGTAVAWRQNAFAVIVRNAALHGNTNPKPTDLYGMTFGAVTAGSPYIFWKAFVNEQHLDASKIREVSIGPPGYAQMAQGQVDFLANFASAKTDLESNGVPVTALTAANFGQQGYGLAIFANSDWLTGHGADMKHFLTATARGMAWSANHPTEALQIEAKTNPALVSSPTVTKANLDGFRTDADLWAPGAQFGQGTYLQFDDAGLKATEQILYDGGVLTGPVFDVVPHWTQKYVPDISTYQTYRTAP